MDFLQSMGVVLVPLMIPVIGFSYLYLLFSHENYMNKKGQEYFCELYFGESPPHDSSFWCLLKIEKEREERKAKKEIKKAKRQCLKQKKGI